MAKERLSAELSARIEEEKLNHTYIDRSFVDSMAIRRHSNHTPTPVWRPKFAKDIDRIM